MIEAIIDSRGYSRKVCDDNIKEPIMEFKNIEQAYECLKEWQTRLFLDDWIIKLSLVKELKDTDNQELIGQNAFQIENKSCIIRLVKMNEDNGNRIVKFCHECILVHELLHCKYNWVLKYANNLEYVYYDTLEHSLIEQMAKSLIMAKYNLTFDWFKNFEETR